MNPANLLMVVQALSLSHDLYLKFQRGALTSDQLMVEWEKLQLTFPMSLDNWKMAGDEARERGFED